MAENQAHPEPASARYVGRRGAALRALLIFIVTSLFVGWPLEAQSRDRDRSERRDRFTNAPEDESFEDLVRGRGRGRRGSSRGRDRGSSTIQAPEPPGLLRFEVPFSEESGGGSALAFAGELRQLGEIYQLSGQVDVRYRDIRLRADSAELDREHKTLVAFGNIILDQGPMRLTGVTIDFDLDAETGVLTEAKGYVSSSDYYFRGAEIRKTGEINYTVVDGLFTSCSQEVPSWSFRMGRTDLQVDGLAFTRNATLRIKKLPVFYIPYLVWPVKASRTSGFLMPKPASSARRGSGIGLAYFQAFGRSADTTVYLDLFSKGYSGLGNEIRYMPSETTLGLFRGYAVEDPDFGATRWKASLVHRSDTLPFGMRGIVDVQEVSDFDFYHDFEREVRRNSRRHNYSTAYVSGNWGRQSVNVLFDQRVTLLRENAQVKQRQLPEVEYKLRSTRLGNTPLYLSGRGAAHLFEVVRNENYDNTYFRGHFAPTLSLPLRAFPWLNLNLRAGARYTYWSDSLRTGREIRDAEDDFAFRGEALTRFQPLTFAEVVGPSFSRTFEGKGKRWARFKHVIEPRFTYVDDPVFEDQRRIPRFDELDFLRSGSVIRYALANKLLAKSAGEDSAARQILLLDFFQDHSLDPDRPLQQSLDGTITDQAGPIVGRIRYNPSLDTLIGFETRYSTLFGQVESNALSGTIRTRLNSYGIRWTQRIQPETGNVRRSQVRLSTSLLLWDERIRLLGSVAYDLVDSLASSQRYVFDYSGQCYGITLELSEFQTLNRPDVLDREFRFSIRLKNVGDFLDITSGGNERL